VWSYGGTVEIFVDGKSVRSQLGDVTISHVRDRWSISANGHYFAEGGFGSTRGTIEVQGHHLHATKTATGGISGKSGTMIIDVTWGESGVRGLLVMQSNGKEAWNMPIDLHHKR
jgi:hypothetical protein